MINLIPGKKGTGKTKILVDSIKKACLLYTSDAADD